MTDAGVRRPAAAPPRPINAYAIFLKTAYAWTRTKLGKAAPELAVLDEVAREWDLLDTKGRAPYEALAAKDAARYSRAAAAHRGAWTVKAASDKKRPREKKASFPGWSEPAPRSHKKKDPAPAAAPVPGSTMDAVVSAAPAPFRISLDPALLAPRVTGVFAAAALPAPPRSGVKYFDREVRWAGQWSAPVGREQQHANPRPGERIVLWCIYDPDADAAKPWRVQWKEGGERTTRRVGGDYVRVWRGAASSTIPPSLSAP